MTTLVDAREGVYSRFSTQWGTRTPFTFENEDFDSDAQDTWARLTVRNIGGGQETLGPAGGRKYTRDLAVFVDVFVPASEEGMRTLDGHLQAARDIFEGSNFSGLYFNDAQVRELGTDGDSVHGQMEALFFYEEIK